MSYQYNVEVISTVPADALVGAADGAKYTITLRCVRRDAVFRCTEVPISFEVRNAPDYDLLECALVSRDDAHTVLARATMALVMGGPHRTVGAVWVPLERVGSCASTESGKAPAQPIARIFVSWTMLTMDGSPLRACALEVPPSSLTRATPAGGEGEPAQASATPRTSVETSPLATTDAAIEGGGAAVAVSSGTSASYRGLAATGLYIGEMPSVGPGGNADSFALSPHVSIVLDERQEAAQLRGGERGNGGAGGGARRPLSEPPSALHSVVIDSKEDVTVVDAEIQQVQHVVLSAFPKCSVSTELPASPPPPPPSVSAVATKETVEGSGESSSHPSTFVNLYATSTQSIGDVPFEMRFRNLHLVPCPLVLDQLSQSMRPSACTPADGGATSSAAAASSTKVGSASNELWKVSHRHGAAGSTLSLATSAVESIRLEHEARQKSGARSSTAPAGAEGKAGAADGNAPVMGVSGASTLTLLRQQAMAAMRQRKVAYST